MVLASRLTELLEVEMLNSNQQFFCSIPSISKACKAAVQTAKALTIAVSVHGMEDIYNFFKWFVEYCSTPNTVRSGSVYIDSGDMSDVEMDVVDALLAQSLQLAERAGCSTGFIRRSVLRSLPAHYLTCLQLENIKSKNIADIHIGLCHLTNLDSLQLTTATGLALDVCMPAIAKLTNLTSLVLQGVDVFNCEQLPVPKLQRLLLVLEYSESSEPPVAVSVSHLTSLIYLSIALDRYYGEHVVFGPLPTQLVELHLGFGVSSSAVALDITSVTHLERVFLNDSCETAANLLALRTLPRLQHVHVGSNNSEAFTAASASWPHLLQLHSVGLLDPNDCISVASLEQLMHNISVTTSMTRLHLQEVQILITGPGEQPMPPFCRGLANLSGLQELCLWFEEVDQLGLDDPIHDFVAGDVQQLSALTQLTHLHLNGPDKFVMDDDVVVLALHLQRLRALYVPVRSVPVLATICHGGSKDLKVVGIYAHPNSLWQDAAWQRYVSESRFDIEVMLAM